MTWLEILTLGGAGCAAGVVNAIAGGGTLLTFPVLAFASHSLYREVFPG